jgi:hypothetical protein
MTSRPITPAPPMIHDRYFSKKVGSAAMARRGLLVDRLRVVVGGRLALELGGGVAEGEVSGARVPSLAGVAASAAGGGVWGAGRGVTGRRERLATDWKSPVGAMARGARGRRAKAYGSGRFRAGPVRCQRTVTAR